MAIELGDNIKTGAPKPTDSRYLNNQTPWASVSEVNTNILGGVGGLRYTGLTVNINGEEYWYKNGIGDGDLELKSLGGGGTSSLNEFTITGNSSATGFTIIHGLNKQFVMAQIVENASPYPTVYTNIERTNANCVCVTFDSPPANGVQYKILIIN